MKKTSRVLALVLVLVMMFAFSSCTMTGMGTTANNNTTKDTGYTNTEIDNLISDLEEALVELIDDNTSLITQLEVEFEELMTELEGASEELSASLEELLGAYNSAIEVLDTEIIALNGELEAATADFNSKLSALQLADDGLDEKIEQITADYEAKIAEVEAKITACECEKETATVDYSEKIAALEAADAKIIADMAAITADYEAKIAAVEAKITACECEKETTTVDYSERIAALESTVGQNSAEVAALRAEYDAKMLLIDADIAALKSEKGGIGADYSAEISALEAGVSANLAAIGALRSEYEAKMLLIDADIAALKAQKGEAGADYSAEISALEANVSANAAAISALRSEYEAKVSELEGKITDCECKKESAGADYSAEIAAIQSELASINAEMLTAKSTFGARLDALEANSAAFVEIDATLSKAGAAADAEAVGEAIDEINATVVLLSGLLESKPIYGNVYTPIDITSEEYNTVRKGYYLGTNGVASANSSYSYTEKIAVLPGDVISVMGYYPDKPTNSNNYAKAYSMRMACVYDANGVAKSNLGFSVGAGKMEYTIPEGGAYISVTYTKGNFLNGFTPVLVRYTSIGESFVLSDASNSESVVKALAELATLKETIEVLENDIKSLDAESIQALAANVVTLNQKIDALDLDKLNEAIESIKNLDTNGMNIIVNAALGSSSIEATADKLVSGAGIQLENNTIINNKNLTFTCDIPEEGIGEGIIRLGHGKTSYGASYIEITATKLIVYSYASGPSVLAEFTHNLTLKDYVTVSIDADYHWAEFRLMTATGYYTNSKNWQGRNGAIFAEVENCEVTNVSMRWFSEEYQNPIWMVGDSYFNSKDESRWTSYLVSGGYKNFLMMSYPGMASERGITEVKQALQHGTPQYIIWCMGMNNGDSNGGTTVNAKYLEATEEFLAICEEKGIIPILSTIPSTPTVYNEAKNAWVREWARTTGGRYIDFARAVSDQTYDASLKGQPVTGTSTTSEKTNTTGYQWYAGMLHGDAVHPGKLGAQALFMQFLADFPEIMREK